MKKIILILLLQFSFISAFSQNEKTKIVLNDSIVTYTSLTDKEIILNGKSEIHLTVTSQLLTNSIIRMNSDDSWIYLDNIRPSAALTSILPYLYVKENQAVNKTNTRVAIYKHGSVIMPHPASFKPLKVYTGQNFTGDSMANYSLFTKYTSLGTMNNKIRSFKLKKGYMATFATGSDGTGYSRVYIADEKDLEIDVLPIELDNVISYIRVFTWEWVTKKGWCGTGGGSTGDANKVNATWFYSWSADQNSSTNLEYVPIRQKLGWPGWDEIGGKQYVTHVLGLNEPDHPEQHKDDNGGKAITVAQALAQWPDHLRTGLRVGTPATTDFGWLYSFMDSCRARNYRVDYVAIHAYWGGKSPQNWYNDLKYIHEKTGRPIWITEWNNGANWTSESWPSDFASQQTKQLNDIKAILNVLDTAHFVERYSIYNWVEDKRAMILNGALTPAGEYYNNNKSQVSFKRVNEVIPKWNFTNKPYLSLSFSTNNRLSLSVTDLNGEYYQGYILEKKTDDGDFKEVANNDDKDLKSYTDTVIYENVSRVRYRVRTKLPQGNLSVISDEFGYDITRGSDWQYGNAAISNLGWLPVMFIQPYSALPAIITGSPTNNNFYLRMGSRAKIASASSRFNIQVTPWTYQNALGLSKVENVPYLITKTGSPETGGLNAQAGTKYVTANWTPITFDTPFTDEPVVFASQSNTAQVMPTAIRIRNVTKTGFEVRLQKEEAITTIPLSESFSFLAMNTGQGIIGNKKIIVGKTAANSVGPTYSTINYGDSIADPVFIAHMQTCNDATITSSLRTLSVTNKYATVVKQREISASSTNPVKETVAWLVIDQATIMGNDNIKHVTKTEFYPNPVKDFIYITNTDDSETEAEIFNLSGTKIKSAQIVNRCVDLRDINAGFYLIKTNKTNFSKFIKQ
jgi:hypothetical protein